jgi:hypothetical protein
MENMLNRKQNVLNREQDMLNKTNAAKQAAAYN